MSRRSSNPLRRTEAQERNPLQGRVSSIINITRVSSMSVKYLDWRPPRLVRGKIWYVVFYYRVPIDLQAEYNCEWYRFRVNHGINKYRDEKYCQDIIDSLNYSLEKGFNPFVDVQQDFALNANENKDMTVKQAMNFFIEKHKEKGLEKSTIQRYEGVVRLILNYFADNKLLGHAVTGIRKHHVEALLSTYRQNHHWSNRQQNNMKGYISTIFQFLLKSEVIEKNPVAFIPKLKSKSTKHKYYDKQLFPKVIEVIKANDMYLFYAVSFVYYLCVRSSKELRLMKVGDIVDEGKYFLFRSEASKSDREDLIPIDTNLIEVIKEMGLLTADKSKYIFGIKHEPGDKPVNADYFSSRFAKIRKLAGLESSHTMYSFKYTRVVHLLRDGAKLADVSKLMRHKDIAVTALYARQLNVDFDSSELQKLSRKI